jgi:hypothetical protein
MIAGSENPFICSSTCPAEHANSGEFHIYGLRELVDGDTPPQRKWVLPILALVRFVHSYCCFFVPVFCLFFSVGNTLKSGSCFSRFSDPICIAALLSASFRNNALRACHFLSAGRG